MEKQYIRTTEKLYDWYESNRYKCNIFINGDFCIRKRDFEVSIQKIEFPCVLITFKNVDYENDDEIYAMTVSQKEFLVS